MARQGYAKLSNGLWLNDKVNDLIDANPHAFAMWTLAISYCSDELNDGVLTARALRRIGADERDVDDLVSFGMLDELDDGRYAIHDYLKHQNSREEVEKDKTAAKERMRRNRAAKRSPEPETVEPETETEPEETRSDEVRPNTERTTTERSDEVRAKFLGLNQNQNQNQIPSPTPPAEGPADGGFDNEGFKAFEDAYPKHGNRQRTLAAYRQTLSEGATPGQLTAAAKTYAKTVRDEGKPLRFVPAPANWLANGQWRDHLPADTGPAMPEDGWIDKHLVRRLPDGADLLAARRRLAALIRQGIPPDQAARTIIREAGTP